MHVTKYVPQNTIIQTKDNLLECCKFQIEGNLVSYLRKLDQILPIPVKWEIFGRVSCRSRIVEYTWPMSKVHVCVCVSKDTGKYQFE